MKRFSIMLAVLAFNHAVPIEAHGGTRRALTLAQTSTRAAQPADVLPICEKALDAAIVGHDAFAVVKDAVKDLPAEQQQAVIVICGVYLSGAVSMLKHVNAAPKIPAGGTSI